MQPEIGGVIVASITPFTQDGKVDEGALREHINFLVSRGVNALFMCGTYGQGPLMSVEQRKETFRIAVEASERKVPVIAHVGSATTEIAVKLSKYAEAVKADAVSSIPPWYYGSRYDEQSIRDYFETVAAAAGLPFFVYNIPEYTGVNISPQLLFKLADEVDNIVGIKDSTNDLVQFCNYISAVKKKGFKYIMGSEDRMLASLVLGAHGAVTTLGNVFPEFYIGIYKAFKEKNYGLAKELQFKTIEIKKILRKGPYLSGYHEAINLLGRQGGYTLRPLRPASPEEKKSLEEGLRTHNLLLNKEIGKRSDKTRKHYYSE